jgi:hypothetical protein
VVEPPRQPALVEIATALTAKVAGLTEAVVQLDRRANRSGRVLLVAVLGLVLDLVLSALVIFTLTVQDQTDTRLEDQIRQQNIIRQAALCPLYLILINSESPQGRKAFPQGAAAYDEIFTQLRAGRAALGCDDATPPP